MEASEVYPVTVHYSGLGLKKLWDPVPCGGPSRIGLKKVYVFF